MKFDIPKKCEVRWQAALAVLEDLQEDTKAGFRMGYWYYDKNKKAKSAPTVNWEHSECGTSACFAGWMEVAPYCKKLGLNSAHFAAKWLTDDTNQPLYQMIFRASINEGSRAKTLAYLKKTLKQIFKDSTGKVLKAPLIFYIDA